MSLSLRLLRVAPQKTCLTNKTNSGKKSLLSTWSKIPPTFKTFQKEKETPLCISLCAGYTVEAAVTFPLFLCFLVFLLFSMRVVLVEVGVQRALDVTSRQAAALWNEERQPTAEELGWICNARILAEHIPVSYVEGNIGGIRYGYSTVSGNEIDLVASYDISFPIAIFGRQTFSVLQRSKNRKWIGWDASETFDGTNVFVTKTGAVYHTKLSCTYLHPVIQSCPYEQVGKKRNLEGGRYQSCQICKAKRTKGKTVFLTEYGNVYHSSLGCSSLKRTIYRRKIEEVQGMPCCHKCGGD